MYTLSHDHASNDFSSYTLTEREIQCIYWLMRGKSVSQISLILERSPKTLEKFVARVKKKLNVYTMFQLGQKVSSLGLTKLLSSECNGLTSLKINSVRPGKFPHLPITRY